MLPLQFQPLSSQPSPSFWAALTAYKLDNAKLDDTPQIIKGWTEEGKVISAPASSVEQIGCQTDHIGIDGSLHVGGNAFGGNTEMPPRNSIPVTGLVRNFNTIEQFRQPQSKKDMFDAVVKMIIDSFSSKHPILNPFLLVAFADLKKYIYHYWFAFPALKMKPAWEIQDSGLETTDLQSIQELRILERGLIELEGLKPEAFLLRGLKNQRAVAPLSSYKQFFSGVPDVERTVVFHDPSASLEHPGWPLRNILYYLHHVHGVLKIRVICLRDGLASRQATIALPSYRQAAGADRVDAVGWERNAGALLSRKADLGSLMDPERLAEQAVDLNLKLMKWRIMPSLDLKQIATTKCLLLGAGTLGCYVARNLMGWGVRNITFVDSGRVSFSNPVRQPLFTFADCLNGGQLKAECAAKRLEEIFPGVNALGYSLRIPMPGHPITQSSRSSVEMDVAKLERLIQTHDAVFLLMDSRESRWLPTLIGASHGKIVINAALGFDSFLVMRHGRRSHVLEADRSDDDALGCYFCSDIVAPRDSLTDRTLDQMCTVARPGVAPMAAALATEMLIALVQHPSGIDAPAIHPLNPQIHNPPPKKAAEIIPHQIRGSLGDWQTALIRGAAFNRCTACSVTILEQYRLEQFDFVLQVCNQASILESLTGLDKLYADSEKIMEQCDWTDSGSEEDKDEFGNISE